MFWSSLLTKIPGFRSPFWLAVRWSWRKQKAWGTFAKFSMFLGQDLQEVLVWSTGNDCDLCLACYHQKGVEQTHHAIRTKLDVATRIRCPSVSATSLEGANFFANKLFTMFFPLYMPGI